MEFVNHIGKLYFTKAIKIEYDKPYTIGICYFKNELWHPIKVAYVIMELMENLKLMSFNLKNLNLARNLVIIQQQLIKVLSPNSFMKNDVCTKN